MGTLGQRTGGDSAREPSARSNRRQTGPAQMLIGLRGVVELVWIIILRVDAAAVKKATAAERQMKSRADDR